MLPQERCSQIDNNIVQNYSSNFYFDDKISGGGEMWLGGGRKFQHPPPRMKPGLLCTSAAAVLRHSLWNTV